MTTILLDMCSDYFDYRIFDVAWNISICHVSCSNKLDANI